MRSDRYVRGHIPTCLPSVVRENSRIRKETKKWKTCSEGLILPFTKQTFKVADGIFKKVSVNLLPLIHPVYIQLMFSCFPFREKNVTFLCSLEILIVHRYETCYMESAHYLCQGMAAGPARIISLSNPALYERPWMYHLKWKNASSTAQEREPGLS